LQAREEEWKAIAEEWLAEELAGRSQNELRISDDQRRILRTVRLVSGMTGMIGTKLAIGTVFAGAGPVSGAVYLAAIIVIGTSLDENIEL
jgi:hypothetical protein